ncbi:MAG: hypothetical protein WC632_03360 [Candidatus Margulisiibacteriota bacterium]
MRTNNYGHTIVNDSYHGLRIRRYKSNEGEGWCFRGRIEKKENGQTEYVIRGSFSALLPRGLNDIAWKVAHQLTKEISLYFGARFERAGFLLPLGAQWFSDAIMHLHSLLAQDQEVILYSQSLPVRFVLRKQKFGVPCGDLRMRRVDSPVEKGSDRGYPYMELAAQLTGKPIEAAVEVYVEALTQILSNMKNPEGEYILRFNQSTHYLEIETTNTPLAPVLSLPQINRR